jgi:hypothetical protein
MILMRDAYRLHIFLNFREITRGIGSAYLILASYGFFLGWNDRDLAWLPREGWWVPKGEKISRPVWPWARSRKKEA